MAKYDWEAIEREYRAGQLSVNQIAKQYGCSEGAIRKRAKKEDWKRDLTHEVRQRAHDKAVRAEYESSRAEDQEIVEAAADRGAQVLQTQRKDLQELRAHGQALLGELQDSDMELPKRTGAYRDLAQAMSRLIPLERQAFNLDESAGTEAPSGDGWTIMPVAVKKGPSAGGGEGDE